MNKEKWEEKNKERKVIRYLPKVRELRDVVKLREEIINAYVNVYVNTNNKK